MARDDGSDSSPEEVQQESPESSQSSSVRI